MPAHRSARKDRRDKAAALRAERQAFAVRLKEARLAADMTAGEAAAGLRVPISTYYSWESGDRFPRQLSEIAAVLRTSVGALYGEASP